MFLHHQRKFNTAILNIRLTNRLMSTQRKGNVDFMPVINIPEKELAYNAFFSLHRPLLCLSGREGFYNKSFEESYDELVEYMMQLETFVPPSTTKK